MGGNVFFLKERFSTQCCRKLKGMPTPSTLDLDHLFFLSTILWLEFLLPYSTWPWWLGSSLPSLTTEPNFLTFPCAIWLYLSDLEMEGRFQKLGQREIHSHPNEKKGQTFECMKEKAVWEKLGSRATSAGSKRTTDSQAELAELRKKSWVPFKWLWENLVLVKVPVCLHWCSLLVRFAIKTNIVKISVKVAVALIWAVPFGGSWRHSHVPIREAGQRKPQ